MSTITPSNQRVTYAAVSATNPDGGEQGQVNLEVKRVSSTCERIKTWIGDHPVTVGLLVGGAVILTTAAALGGINGGFSFFTTSSNSNNSTNSNPNSNSNSNSNSNPNSNSGSAASPTPPKPTGTPCSGLHNFTFNIERHSTFNLTLKGTGNGTSLFSKVSPFYNTEYTVDPKIFCKASVFTGNEFSFNGKTRNQTGGDVHCSSSLTVEQLQGNNPVLLTGDCAVKKGEEVQQYLDCNKLEIGGDNNLKCQDDIAKACGKVENFKAIVPSVKDGKPSSVFITERNASDVGQAAEFRVYYSNYEANSTILDINVKKDCEKMIDAGLAFECCDASSTYSKSEFTLRGLIGIDDEGMEDITGAACQFNGTTGTEKKCELTFGASNNCGGVLDSSAACKDKMIVLISGEEPANSIPREIELKASKGNATYPLEKGSSEGTDRALFLVKDNEYNKCHLVRGKVKEDYVLSAEYTGNMKDNSNSAYDETANITTTNSYSTVDVKYGSVALTNSTSVPKGYENPCDTKHTYNETYVVKCS